jgi:zinc protease
MKLLSEHPFGAGGRSVRHFRLDNGLELLLLADPSAPVIAYQTWFRVGSRHEREGITGIAHLFEHLMFNQTEHLAPGEFDRKLEQAGGDTNAATWVDWTFYRNNLPRAELGLAVELESDRMAHLTLGDTQVESEREVVANERRFRVEDDVDGFLSEELFRIAYERHPYHWPTIGWMRDILAIGIDDCRAFYKRFYTPNNASIVIAGDFEEREAQALIEQHYGKIPPHELPPDRSEPEPPQKEERRASWKKPVTADKLRIGYKSPALSHADYLPLEVLSELLFGGKSSRLEKLLVADTEIASSTSASLTPFQDPGLYEISISMQRGHVAHEAERLVDDEIERLKREPLKDGELETAKTRLLTRLWRELRSLGGRAEALGHYHSTLGDYRKLFAVADGVRATREADVQRVARTYLDRAQRTVLVAEPNGETDDEEEGA